MADIDAKHLEKIFRVSQRQLESDIHHHRQANDLVQCLERTKWISFRYP